MSISPVSGVGATHEVNPAAHNPPPNKQAGSTNPPTDTIQLSKAAQAHLQGGDKDHDGDSH